MVLLAICDAENCFTFFDFVNYGCFEQLCNDFTFILVNCLKTFSRFSSRRYSTSHRVNEIRISLAYSFWIGKTTVWKIISETCETIYEVLKEPYFNSSSSTEDWKKYLKDLKKFGIFSTPSNLSTANTFASSTPRWLELYITIIKAPSAWSYMWRWELLYTLWFR